MKSDPAMKDRRSSRCTVIASATALLAACAGGAVAPEAAFIETVRCVDPDQAPVAGTRLELHDGSDDAASWRSDAVVADAAGVARIRRPQLAGGRTSWLVAHTQDRLGYCRLDAQPDLSSGDARTIVLWPRTTIRGRVQTPSGHTQPVRVSVVWCGGTYLRRDIDRFQVQGEARAWPLAAATALPPMPGFDATIGADGSFELPGVAGSLLVLEFRSPGLARKRIRVDAGSPVPDVELAAEAQCEITVRGIDGRPTQPVVWLVSDESHMAFPNLDTSMLQARLDGDGRVRLDALPAGDHYVTVVSPDAALHRQRVQLAAGRTEHVTVQLDAGVIVTGTVRDPQGRGVAGVRIFAVPVEEPTLWNVGEARTDANGGFVVRLPRRALRVHVFELPEGYSPEHDALPLDLTGNTSRTATFDVTVRRP